MTKQDFELIARIINQLQPDSKGKVQLHSVVFGFSNSLELTCSNFNREAFLEKFKEIK